MTQEQTQALASVAAAIATAVNESGPKGIPAGTLYAMLMGHGCSLGQFEGIMMTLVRMRLVEYASHCYYPANKATIQ